MDHEYQELQMLLRDQPEAGAVIRGAGGVRRLWWRAPGRSKRGGYRVIYYPKIEQGVSWMLTRYPKNVKDDISAPALRAIRDEVENG
jgi:hypothetical protein